jgi:hypothetical protein
VNQLGSYLIVSDLNVHQEQMQSMTSIKGCRLLKVEDKL